MSPAVQVSRLLGSIGCVAVLLPASICRAEDTPEVVAAVIKARTTQTANLIAVYRLEETYLPPPKLLRRQEEARKQGILLKTKQGKEVSRCEFRFLDGRSQYDWTLGGASTDGQEARRFLQSFDLTRYEQLEAESGSPVARGAILARHDLPRASLEIGLGLRGFGSERWLTASTIDACSVAVSGDDSVSVDLVEENGVLHRWILQRQYGYAPESYERYVDGDVLLTCSNTDFRDVQGVMLPYAMSIRVLAPDDGKKVTVLIADIAVDEYVLNSPENTASAYAITWPVGARVVDMRTDGSPHPVFEIAGEPKKLGDDFIAKKLAGVGGEERGNFLLHFVAGTTLLFCLVAIAAWVARRRGQGRSTHREG